MRGFQWNVSLDDIFARVSASGNGAMALIGMGDPTFTHVVVIANDHGVVEAVEGQADINAGTPRALSLEEAKKFYNPNRKTIYGVAILKQKAKL